MPNNFRKTQSVCKILSATLDMLHADGGTQWKTEREAWRNSGLRCDVNWSFVLWDFTRRTLVVTDVSGQYIDAILKGQEVHSIVRNVPW